MASCNGHPGMIPRLDRYSLGMGRGRSGSREPQQRPKGIPLIRRHVPYPAGEVDELVEPIRGRAGLDYGSTYALVNIAPSGITRTDSRPTLNGRFPRPRGSPRVLAPVRTQVPRRQ